MKQYFYLFYGPPVLTTFVSTNQTFTSKSATNLVITKIRFQVWAYSSPLVAGFGPTFLPINFSITTTIPLDVVQPYGIGSNQPANFQWTFSENFQQVEVSLGIKNSAGFQFQFAPITTPDPGFNQFLIRGHFELLKNEN